MKVVKFTLWRKHSLFHAAVNKSKMLFSSYLGSLLHKFNFEWHALLLLEHMPNYLILFLVLLWVWATENYVIRKTPWRNGSASDSRSEGCVFESRRGHLIFSSHFLWHWLSNWFLYFSMESLHFWANLYVALCLLKGPSPCDYFVTLLHKS